MKNLPYFVLLLSFSVQAQMETFQMELGNFFSQGYGGENDEEILDLVEVYDNFILTGWQDTLKEEIVTKDLVVYSTNSKGKLLSKGVFGDPVIDDIGTGITMVGTDYVAVSVYQTSNFNPEKFTKVNPGDRLQVYLFDIAGNVQWIYTHTASESGLAPVDIRYFNSNIYVLANEYVGTNATAARILKIDLSGNLIGLSAPSTSNNSSIWCSELEMMNSTLATIGNDGVGKFPHLLNFDPSTLQLTSSISLSSYANHFLFGFVMDSTSNNYTAAGFVIDEENDTNALLMRLDPAFSPILVKSIGILGTEKFHDIGSIGDGFISTGVRNNKGQGGYDNFICHLSYGLDTLYNQTDGGNTNERNRSLLILKDLNAAYLGGYNKQYGITSSGNSYVLGVLTMNYVNSWTYSCNKIPRVILIDRLLDDNHQVDVNLSQFNYTTVLDNVKNMGADIVFLYDVDYLFANWNTLPANDSRALLLQDFLDYAHNNKGLIIGLIIGPSRDKAIRVADAVDGKTRYNYDFSGKVNLVMLEHEFWSCYSPNSEVVLSEFVHTPTNKFYFPNGLYYDKDANTTATLNDCENPWHQTQNTSSPITNNDKDAFYSILVEDHFKMLEMIDSRKTHSSNMWKSFDYLGFVTNHDNGYTPIHYDKVYSDPTKQSISTYQFRQLYSEKTAQWTNGVFLNYYRNGSSGSSNLHTNGSINFDLDYGANPSTDWVPRLQGLAENYSNWNPNGLRVIPLHSAEEVNCSELGVTKLGPWLGGTNRPNIAEYQYAAQYRDDFRIDYPAAATHIVHVANGWFQYTCLASKMNSYSIGANDPFSGVHDVFDCNVYTSSGIGIEENQLKKGGLNLYPNPTTTNLTVQLSEPKWKLRSVSVINSSGNEVFYQSIAVQNKKDNITIDISNLAKGIYFVKVENHLGHFDFDRFVKN